MASSRNSPSTNPLERAVQESLAALPHGSNVGVALSGGLDSSVLLSIAARTVPQMGHSLKAIHVHHGLSLNANSWAAFCHTLCSELSLPLDVVHIDVPRDTGEGLEATARRLRYHAFKAQAVDRILLAHHANDQAETLLFNLMRGAGVRGAAGIPSATGRYLRPLLAF